MISDELVETPILASTHLYKGMVWDVWRERFHYQGQPIEREFVAHPGAVGVLALNEREEALLIKQYRHPIRTREWEVPAGMLDLPGEPPLAAAQRELAEEVDMQAKQWHTLIDFTLTPGGSNEVMRVYLARELCPTEQTFERRFEEADMQRAWVPLDEVVESVLARRVQNPVLMLAALAAHEGRRSGWKQLAAADAPWQRHQRLQTRNRAGGGPSSGGQTSDGTAAPAAPQ